MRSGRGLASLSAGEETAFFSSAMAVSCAVRAVILAVRAAMSAARRRKVVVRRAFSGCAGGSKG